MNRRQFLRNAVIAASALVLAPTTGLVDELPYDVLPFPEEPWPRPFWIDEQVSLDLWSIIERIPTNSVGLVSWSCNPWVSRKD